MRIAIRGNFLSVPQFNFLWSVSNEIFFGKEAFYAVFYSIKIQPFASLKLKLINFLTPPAPMAAGV